MLSGYILLLGSKSTLADTPTSGSSLSTLCSCSDGKAEKREGDFKISQGWTKNVSFMGRPVSKVRNGIKHLSMHFLTTLFNHGQFPKFRVLICAWLWVLSCHGQVKRKDHTHY